MLATDWQQHSVRGFLAGTVKKKLGFPLTSSKTNDGARRYRIEKQFFMPSKTTGLLRQSTHCCDRQRPAGFLVAAR